MRPVCLFCETPVKPRRNSPFAPCPKCKQWRQVIFIAEPKDTEKVGGYVINYYVDVPKKQCVIQASDGNYRFSLTKRKDAYALEQLLYAACIKWNLDYRSEDHVKAFVQNAVDSFWVGTRLQTKKESATA